MPQSSSENAVQQPANKRCTGTLLLVQDIYRCVSLVNVSVMYQKFLVAPGISILHFWSLDCAYTVGVKSRLECASSHGRADSYSAHAGKERHYPFAHPATPLPCLQQ